MESHLRTEVVVVGGGPVGMLLAAELGERGVRTVVLEALASVCERPKARVLHARALQGLVRRGYLTELVPRVESGGAEREMPFRFGGVPGLTLTVPAWEPGPVLRRPQADLERLFERRARAAGVRILREHRVARVLEMGETVQVVAEGPSGLVEFAASYVVGADGGRGVVRELAGVPARSWAATTSGLAGLVHLDGGRRWDGVEPGWHRTERGWLVVHDFPGEGTFVRTLDCSGPHGDRRVPPTAAELQEEMCRIAGREVRLGPVRWLSRFSDFARLAESFRWGRVFLAGDAAHVHFPVGAQGLSLGVQDALNLGWKLALVVRGRAGDGLLDTYDAERRPAARRVMENVSEQLELMRSQPEAAADADADALRGLFAGAGAGAGARARAVGGCGGGQGGRNLSGLISGQDVVLPGCDEGGVGWEGRFLPNAPLRTAAEGDSDVIGLLRSGSWLLLCSGAEGGRYARLAGVWGDAVRTVRLKPGGGMPCGALLVRPDGYVVWASAARPGPGSVEEVSARLAGVLGRYLGGRPSRSPAWRRASAGARLRVRARVAS